MSCRSALSYGSVNDFGISVEGYLSLMIEIHKTGEVHVLEFVSHNRRVKTENSQENCELQLKAYQDLACCSLQKREKGMRIH